ncbi:MAG: multicopper oxidase domain-containing protein, partial [Gemmatimonadales bacterium]
MSGRGMSRRQALKRAGLGLGGLAAASTLAGAAERQASHDPHTVMTGGMPPAERSGIDPVRFLTHFDYGQVDRMANGRTVREYSVSVVDR